MHLGSIHSIKKNYKKNNTDKEAVPVDANESDAAKENSRMMIDGSQMETMELDESFDNISKLCQVRIIRDYFFANNLFE